MDAVVEMFRQTLDQLLGRASGPMHSRLIVQPLVAALLAIRAGLGDAREGRPPFFWTFATVKSARRELVRLASKDLGKVIVVALILDAAYQIFVLRGFFVWQWLIVAFAVAVVPYVPLRGLVARIARTVKRMPPRVGWTPPARPQEDA